MGGSVVAGVFVLIFGAVFLFTGGGEAAAADVEGVAVGEDGVMVFEDEEPSVAAGGAEPVAAARGAAVNAAGAAPAPGGGGGGDSEMIAEGVAATLEAMFPTLEPTEPPDYVATLEAGLHRSRAGSSSLSLSALDPGRERVGGLSEAEIELFGEYGVYFWDVLQAWVVVRGVLYSRDVFEWERTWLEEQVDLVGWLMPGTGFWSDQGRRNNDGVGEVVRAYLDEVREGEYAFRDSVTSMNEALGVFERAGVERFRDLGPEEAEEVWQLYFNMETAGYALGDVMSAYGCSICGELYRASGTAVRPEP